MYREKHRILSISETKNGHTSHLGKKYATTADLCKPSPKHTTHITMYNTRNHQESTTTTNTKLSAYDF